MSHLAFYSGLISISTHLISLHKKEKVYIVFYQIAAP